MFCSQGGHGKKGYMGNSQFVDTPTARRALRHLRGVVSCYRREPRSRVISHADDAKKYLDQLLSGKERPEVCEALRQIHDSLFQGFARVPDLAKAEGAVASLCKLLGEPVPGRLVRNGGDVDA
jgi:hypothetical protein